MTKHALAVMMTKWSSFSIATKDCKDNYLRLKNLSSVLTQFTPSLVPIAQLVINHTKHPCKQSSDC